MRRKKSLKLSLIHITADDNTTNVMVVVMVELFISFIKIVKKNYCNLQHIMILTPLKYVVIKLRLFMLH